MLADVPQEREHIHVPRPVQIIDHNGRRFTGIEIDETGHLLANLVDPAGNNIGRIELPLLRLERGVTYQPCGATDQRQRTVARQLKAAQH